MFFCDFLSAIFLLCVIRGPWKTASQVDNKSPRYKWPSYISQMQRFRLTTGREMLTLTVEVTNPQGPLIVGPLHAYSISPHESHSKDNQPDSLLFLQEHIFKEVKTICTNFQICGVVTTIKHYSINTWLSTSLCYYVCARHIHCANMATSSSSVVTDDIPATPHLALGIISDPFHLEK